MFTITISTTPGRPGRVFGRVGLQGTGFQRDCELAFRGRMGMFGVGRLEHYAIGVEPLVGLLGRLILLSSDEDYLQECEPVSYVSISVYQGDHFAEEALREHLVAKSNGVLLEVEFTDEDRERRTAGAAHRYSSAVTLAGHAISTLLWSGGKPTPLLPLTTVRPHEENVACVLAAEIPLYTRRRFLRSLGCGQGPTPEMFLASDWEDFLSGVQEAAEGNCPWCNS